MAVEPGSRCGGRLPVVPRATGDYGLSVEPDQAGPSWSWVRPDAAPGPAARPGRTCADVELRHWGKSGRRVAEAAACAALAEVCPAVTSHGLAVSRLADQLRQFARTGRVGHPQVYPTHPETDPLRFVRRCLAAWRRLGFDGPTLVPILELGEGERKVEVWINECLRQGLTWHLWRLGDWSDRWASLVSRWLPEPEALPPPVT